MEKIRQIEEVENILVAAALLPWPANCLQYDGKDRRHRNEAVISFIQCTVMALELEREITLKHHRIKKQ